MLLVGTAAAEVQLAANSASQLTRLSIEELAQVEVSSVSRRPERLSDAAAAIYVITREDIRLAGVATLAEALRLAPNLQVARTNAHGYAVSARGFNDTSANKLLVMIDGRTVYTPLHSGVFWDAQDVMLADVERIEVVSGPGGTLWGANAVNGVINILTRPAADTQGTVATLVAGNDERGAALRHGLQLGASAAVRAYARSFRFDQSERADGAAAGDAWKRSQAGFRVDGHRNASAWTLQGDVQDGEARVPGAPTRQVKGANLLARLRHEFDARSGLTVQMYWDQYSRKQPGFFSEDLDTVDIDVQHHWLSDGGHELVWGGGYRHQRDDTRGGALLAFEPARSTLTFANVFAQDTITLGERGKLTIGLKAERNSYTGTEYQPNVRLSWKASEQAMVWAAVSRALRTPSRLDRDFQVFIDLPPPYGGRLLGGPDFTSERLTAYEIGYRGQPNERLSYSVNAFVNDYDRLRSVESNGSGDFVLGNKVKGRSHGIEAWGSLQASDTWRLHAGLSLLRKKLSFEAGSTDPGSASAGANDPRYQLMLRSNWSLPRNLTLNLGLRHVDALPSPAVARYTALDASLGWVVSPSFEVSLSGFNLLDDRHAEFGAAPGRSEFGRHVLLRLTWTL
ncbi:Colicin I receptor [Burkholderiaceae bacterium]|nr:Colicin I receptor [Burkholderiaceae bacterium]